MLNKITGVLGGVPDSKTRNDDELSDRLSHRYTTALLIVFAFVVSTKQYVGDPINCWVPAEFTSNHEEYANSYCWIRNTYYLAFDEHIPKDGAQKQEISYYQWIPILLPFQALLFYLPCLLWRSLNNSSGIDVNNIVEAGQTFQDTERVEERAKTLIFMTKQMDRYLVSQTNHGTAWTVSLKRLLSRLICSCCGRRHGNYLVPLYVIIKMLYISNVIGQLFLLDTFLGANFHAYGIDVLRAIWYGEDWTNDSSPRFPRITMCNLAVRQLGIDNLRKYTVQCVLPINLFNEKIYLFVWFWMVLVATIACVNLLSTILRAVFRSDRHRFIKKHLKFMNKLHDDKDKLMVPNFVENYLKQDGILVLRLLRHNTNTLTTTEFICALWDNWREKKIDNKPQRAVRNDTTQV